MEHEYKRLFAYLKQEVPSKGLVDRIIATAAYKNKKRAQVKLIYNAFIFALSIVLFIPAIQYLGREATQSGFFQYGSLMFSDGTVIAVFWKELSLSLAESFPVFGSLATLSVGFAFLFALRGIITNKVGLVASHHQFN
ncbi:MAG: hypothetical protein WCW78_00340 [Candidatus Paceibacterota bacterium]|jgi:hypothetical protein